MLDLTTTKGKIIDAALRLAANHGWSGLSLDQIANEAGVGLADFRKEFSTKAEILAAYTRSVDDAVLAKVTPADAATPARDRLFDVLMNRFELMAPHKPGLQRIAADMRRRPGEGLAQLGPAARSIYWMLAAAGIEAEGGRGALRVPGVMSIYARAFDTWLEDDDAGLARTMAVLDGRLRRAERFVQRLDDMGAAASRFFSNLKTTASGAKRGGHSPADDMPPAGANDSHPPQPPQPPSSGEPGPAPAM
jgi:ubiquinone biosynthesis protein COQ9